MDLMERFSNAGVVPVVVLEDAGQALSTARALLAGGIDVMEITFRTDAARDAIQIVAEQCPDMLVGAGTVCSVEQAGRRQRPELGLLFLPALIPVWLTGVWNTSLLFYPVALHPVRSWKHCRGELAQSNFSRPASTVVWRQ